jgi:LPXTG-motif cell wall-anchored protein
MKRTLLVMMGGAIALLIGAAANAVTTSGKVVATDGLTSAITIETDDGKRFPFTMNDTTKIEHEGVNVALGDLREDSRVTVTTEQTPVDPLTAMLATRVQVEAMAIAAPVSDGESAAGTVRVESAGADGDRPGHTAQVQSADYDQSQRRAERLPKTATPLPLIAVFGAGLLACGLVLGMWRRRR